MARRAVRERLGQDVGAWLMDGLISKETHDLLRRRYDAKALGIGQAIQYLGISGGLLVFFGLLGIVGALSESTGVIAFLLLAVGGGLTAGGIHLAADPRGRYTMSCKVVLALGVASAALGVAAAVDALGAKDEAVIVAAGTLMLPVVVFLAYRFANIFLLILGLLGFFHWVGSWTAMWGRSAYVIFIEDPRLMCVAALLAVGAGVWHEIYLRERTGRFYQAYEALGLAYLNLSLLILSIFPEGGSQLPWVLAFAAAGIAQIVAGARLHNGLFTGFGVTALAVNLYTRYFEYFWERTHKGVFFLVGGVSLLGAGLACEILLKRIRSTSP
jgi:hypothetical protein